MNVINILRIVMTLGGIVFLAVYIPDLIKHKKDFDGKHYGKLTIIALITEFFDTWGIGAFATMSTGFKLTKTVDDSVLPGTMNVGNCIIGVLQGWLFLQFVQIDGLTLVSMIAAAVVGAVWGAKIVCRWDVRKVRIGLGVGLALLAVLMFLKNANFGPFGLVGTATSLRGWKLAVGIIGNFFLGALMDIGVGFFAPCMALIFALGMNPGAAFPIMMGSCALLMPGCGIQFIKEGKYDRKAAAFLSGIGILSVIAAFLLMKYAIDLHMMIWIICIVMVYTSVMFFRDARKGTK